MMFAVHTRRLQSHIEPGLGDRVLGWLMAIEPYVAASFLFIAGYSLVLSHGQGGGMLWYRKLLLRALVLYLLAVALFVPQYGIAWPDLLVSPGILSAIALSIAVVGAFVARNASSFALGILALAVLLVTHWLDAPGRTIPGLDAGPGGVFPLLAFAGFGAVLARLRERFGLRALSLATFATLPLFVFAWQSGAAWTTTEISQYPAHAGQLALGSLFATGARQAVPFWNHSAIGALGLSFGLVATLALFLSLPTGLTGSRLLAPLRMLGRHALAAYVAHLGVLGLIDLGGKTPKSAAGTWLLIGLLAAGATLLATLLDGSSPVARLARRLYSQKA